MPKYPVTPIGKVVIASLGAPSTTYNPDGDYYAKVVFPADALVELEQTLAALQQAKYAEVVDEIRSKSADPTKAQRMVAKITLASLPVEDGEDPGTKQVSFKQRAAIEPKSGKFAGQKLTLRPALFDAHGQPMDPVSVLNMGRGSKVRIAYEAVPFFVASLGVGVSLRLKAVQIVEFVEWNGGDAETFGFTPVATAPAGVSPDALTPEEEALFSAEAGDF